MVQLRTKSGIVGLVLLEKFIEYCNFDFGSKLHIFSQILQSEAYQRKVMEPSRFYLLRSAILKPSI